MANDLRDHVWKLDTAALVTDETVLVDGVRWIPANATDRFTLANGLGDIVFDSGVAPVAGPPPESVIPFRCIKGMTLAYVSGTPVVYVYGKLYLA